MRAIAPGKLVVSGAYSVLWGAPALVTAVDRYVVADSKREPDFLAPEVACAISGRAAPWFDASALRAEGRKLGLGSSAAIVVASLGAIELEREPGLDQETLAKRVFPVALAAHRKAQRGGSGIDVAASAFGGTLRCRARGTSLDIEGYPLPDGVEVSAYADKRSSSTAGMVAAVKALAEREPRAFDRRMGELVQQAVDCALADGRVAFLEALRAQVLMLGELGDVAGVPIVPAPLRALATAAWADGVVVMPSGAGGGDVVLALGEPAGVERHGTRLEQDGLTRVGLRIGAGGVQREGSVEAMSAQRIA